MHNYYKGTLHATSPLIYDGQRISKHLQFACCTLNVGDQCVCFAHVDSLNLAGGLCLVSPFGSFDSTRGGHLILHDLKLALEVPPGSSVLFPSAIITHENIPIRDGELRQSITAFTPGSLFQWVDNGFSSVRSLSRSKDSKQHRRKHLVSSPTLWRIMVSRFPHISTI